MLSKSAAEPSAVAFNLEDWSNQEEQYLQQVKAHAQHVIEKTREHANTIRDAAEVEGRAEAQRNAEASLNDVLDQKLSTVIPALAQVAAKLDEARTAWIRNWEHQLIDLALAMAERITRQQLDHRPEIQIGWVREALQLAADGGKVKVRLHPGDRETLAPRLEKLSQELQGLGDVTFDVDPAIEPGGCIVHTEFGRIDQQLSSQLARLREELNDEHLNHQNDDRDAD